MNAVAEAASVAPETEAGLRDVVSCMQQLIAAVEMPPGARAHRGAQPGSRTGRRLHPGIERASCRARSSTAGTRAGPGEIRRRSTPFSADFTPSKDLAGFLDFPAIQGFAHEVETLLDLARNSKVPVDSALIDIILQSADHMNSVSARAWKPESSRLPTPALLVGAHPGQDCQCFAER